MLRLFFVCFAPITLPPIFPVKAMSRIPVFPDSDTAIIGVYRHLPLYFVLFCIYFTQQQKCPRLVRVAAIRPSTNISPVA